LYFDFAITVLFLCGRTEHDNDDTCENLQSTLQLSFTDSKRNPDFIRKHKPRNLSFTGQREWWYSCPKNVSKPAKFLWMLDQWSPQINWYPAQNFSKSMRSLPDHGFALEKEVFSYYDSW